MSKRLPLLLLDVDGVLNPYPETPAGYDEFDFFPEADEPVRLSRAHIGWLGELAEVFDLVWATGWGAKANQLLSPFFGLPELPLVPLPEVRFDVFPLEKGRAVMAYVGERPAAWIDDLIPADAHRWASNRTEATLFVDVDPQLGLTRAHVQQLLRWAAALALNNLHDRPRMRPL